MAKKVNLKEQLKAAEEQRLRALADYQNLEKRVASQQQQFVKLATAGFILRLLPVLDHLERAVTHLKEPGLEIIIKQFREVLESEGVKPFIALSQPFNHQTMECIESVPGKKELVVEVVETGYLIGDQVLRLAKVKVGNGEQIQREEAGSKK